MPAKSSATAKKRAPAMHFATASNCCSCQWLALKSTVAWGRG